MLVIGMIVAEADWKGLFSRDVLLYCLIRLAVFPVIIRALLKLVVDPLIVSITVILAAMPAGSATPSWQNSITWIRTMPVHVY